MKISAYLSNCFSKNKQCIITLALVVFSYQHASAQAQVNIAFVLKPPYSSYLKDYANLGDKSIITVTNLTATVKQLYLKGSVTNVSEGLYVRTGANYHPSGYITLQPHQTQVFTSSSNVTRFLDANNTETNIVNPDKRNMLRLAQLPEGIYHVCIQAYDFYSNALLSDQNGGCTTINITLASAPFITNPHNAQTIPAAGANSIVYTWTPPIGNLSGGRPVYDLVVVKVMPGQNSNEAINAARDYNANNPIIYKKGLATQTYISQPYDLKPEPGATYAMQVIAKDANNTLSFKNDGKSEIVVFTCDTNKTSPPAPTKTRVSTPGAGSSFTGKNQPYLQLESYTFKGKLVWGYKKN